MLQRTPCFDARPMFILAMTVLAALTPAAALEVGRGVESAEIAVGDDLILSWDGLVPDTMYTAAVVDEYDQVVAEALRKSSSDGVLEPFYVWIGTGIVGCDGDPDPASDEYLFAYPDEAEAVLKGRTFQVALAELETRTSVARFTISMLPKEKNLFYFSDEDGCPRCEYEYGEPVYLSGSLVVLDSFWLFLVEELVRPTVGDPLVDVLGGPIELWPPGSAFVAQVTEELPLCQDHVGVVRPMAGNQPDPYLDAGDIIVDPSFCGAGEDMTPDKSIRVRDPDKIPCED
ncbi:MAG: hypothetical protein GY720_24125 [bacterium]|nr:hypothetical protein [bacterium]